MIARILYWLSGHLPCRLIKVDDQPYLERYFVARIGPFTAYLHRFISADGDRHLHDHPWRAVALVLSGGYTEERLVGFSTTPHSPFVRTVKRRPWWPNFLGLRSFHRIADMQRGTWTLFIHGYRWKGWGFIEPADPDGVPPFEPEQQLTVYTPFRTTDSHHTQGWHKRNPKGKDAGREPLDLRTTCERFGHGWIDGLQGQYCICCGVGKTEQDQ